MFKQIISMLFLSIPLFGSDNNHIASRASRVPAHRTYGIPEDRVVIEDKEFNVRGLNGAPLSFFFTQSRSGRSAVRASDDNSYFSFIYGIAQNLCRNGIKFDDTEMFSKVRHQIGWSSDFLVESDFATKQDFVGCIAKDVVEVMKKQQPVARSGR